MADRRAVARDALARALAAPKAAREAFHEAADIAISAPVGDAQGGDGIEAALLAPLRAALQGVHRRDLICIGGPNARPEGGWWLAVLTHYVGTNVAPLFGVPATGHLAFLRAGEFYRIDNGRITAARIILDLPDLLRQGGRNPFPASLGTELTFPAPATQDGLCPGGGEAAGASSLALVEAMLADLHPYDHADFGSAGQTGREGYWADDMLWYGPAGIGSNYRWQGFVEDHRAPFLRAFPDRRGGNHFCRIGDGPYAAVSGWPSMTMTHKGAYLGVPATGRRLTLRVMDFYRCSGGQIAENWVCLDYVDLFAQIGVDLIARAVAGDC